MVYLMITFSCRAFLRKIEDGSTILTAHDLPSFLYDRKTSYNEHDEVTGLFRGFLLVRVCYPTARHFNATNLPTGLPSYLHWSINSDEPHPQRAKVQGKNVQLGSGDRQDHCLRMCAGEGLVACYLFYFLIQEHQTYIALSTMPKWGNADNQFRLDTLYDDIVSMFEENADNPWVEETLSWWNAYVDIFCNN